MFPLHRLPFHLHSLKWNQDSSPVSSLANNSSWFLWRVSSSWQFCILSSFCLGMRSLGTQGARTFIMKCSWIIAQIFAWQGDVVSCGSSMVTCLFSMMMQETSSTADDIRALGKQPGLIPFLTVSCPLLKVSAQRNTVLWLGAASPHLSSTRTMWSICVYGIHLSLSMTAHHWCNRPAMLYSAIIHWVNVQLPLIPDMHNFLMAIYLCLHVTIMTINNLWTALVNMFQHTLLFFTNIFSQSCDNHQGVLTTSMHSLFYCILTIT